jgi:hypothetical protein
VPNADRYVTTSATGNREYWVGSSDGESYPHAEILPDPVVPTDEGFVWALVGTSSVSFGEYSFQLFWTWGGKRKAKR